MSDKGAAREIEHHRADDRVGGDSLQQRRAAGNDGHGDDQDRRDDGDDLLDSFLPCTDARDMLVDARAAVGAYAAAFDDEIDAAFRAFDFSSQWHDKNAMRCAIR